MNALKLTLSGPFAHYKRLEGSIVKQTHTIPPKTALDGLFAAIIGLERNSYYEEFYTDCDVAVVPENIRRQTIPELLVSTNPGRMSSFASGKAPVHTENRQQIALEFLTDPEFTVYVSPPDEYADELAKRLDSHQYEFQACLGLSECIAHIESHGWTDLDETDATEIDSTVTESAVDSVCADGSQTFERFPTGFEQTEHNRKPRGFMNVVVPLDGTLTITPTDDTTVYTDGDNTLMLY